MGRSRGGLTTKVHALVDANGLPLELTITPGQAGDCPEAANLLMRLEPGSIMLADKGYDADWLRRAIEAKGAVPNIPAKRNRVWNHASARHSIGTATVSSVSSIGSNISDGSQHATKSMAQTSSPCSSSPPSKSGYALMSL